LILANHRVALADAPQQATRVSREEEDWSKVVFGRLKAMIGNAASS